LELVLASVLEVLSFHNISKWKSCAAGKKKEKPGEDYLPNVHG